MCRRQELDLRPNAYETFALPLSYAGMAFAPDRLRLLASRSVAGAGIGPASGAYEAPEITISPPRGVTGVILT